MSGGVTKDRTLTEATGPTVRTGRREGRSRDWQLTHADALHSLQRSAGNQTVTQLLNGAEPANQAPRTTNGFSLAARSSGDGGQLPAFVKAALSEGGERLADTANPLPGDHDLASVRVHTGERAHDSADLLNADAFTVGSDIVFGEGQFAPESTKGRELLRHELMHVLQSRRSATRPTRLVSRAGDASEHAAIGADLGVCPAPAAQIQRQPKSDGAQLPAVVAIPDTGAGVVRVLADGEGVAEVVAPPGASVQGSVHAHVQWVDQDEGSYRIIISAKEGAVARVTPAFQSIAQVHSVLAGDSDKDVSSTDGEKDLSAAEPGLKSLGSVHHILHPPYRLVPYARDRENPIIEHYTAYNTETQTIEHVIPVDQLHAFLSDAGAWAGKDKKRAREQAAVDLAKDLKAVADKTSAAISKINRHSGVERLPTADDAYTGSMMLAQAVEEDLPPTERASTEYAITSGDYRIFPQTKTIDGEERVVVYLAYNTYVGRVEWAIPPTKLDDFLSNPQGMLNSAALVIDAQNLGTPGVKKLTPEQLAYYRYVHALVAEQDLGKALPQVGAAWKAKIDEWRQNPASFLLYAAQFVPIGGYKSSPGGPKSRPPSVAANKPPAVTPSAPKVTPKPVVKPAKPIASPTPKRTTPPSKPTETPIAPTAAKSDAPATPIAKSRPTTPQSPAQPQPATTPGKTAKPPESPAIDISRGRRCKTSAETKKIRQILDRQGRDKADEAMQMPGTERAPSPSEPDSQLKPLEQTQQYDMAAGQSHVHQGRTRAIQQALETQPRPMASADGPKRRGGSAHNNARPGANRKNRAGSSGKPSPRRGAASRSSPHKSTADAKTVGGRPEARTKSPTRDESLADFEYFLAEELDAVSLRVGEPLQMYRYGSRATVVKYLKKYFTQQAKSTGVMTWGGVRVKVKRGVPLETQVKDFMANLEGAHFTPQSFGKKLPKDVQESLPGSKYNPDDALVVITEKSTHTKMDQHWKDTFNAMRRSGQDKATAQQVFDSVADGIRKTPGLSDGEKASRIARLQDDMFVELGLDPDVPYPVPRIIRWWEILKFKSKKK